MKKPSTQPARSSRTTTPNRVVAPQQSTAPAMVGEKIARVDRPGDQDTIAQLAKTLMVRFAQDTATAICLVDPDSSRQTAAHLVDLAGAISAQSDARVLLVDGDIENKHVSKEFEASDADGVAELLNVSQSSSKLVRKGRQGQVDLLPAGRGMVGSQRPLDQRIDSLIQEAKSTYRFVMIAAGSPDSSVTDACARSSEATFLMLRIGHTLRTAGHQALSRLTAGGARVLGCILS